MGIVTRGEDQFCVGSQACSIIWGCFQDAYAARPVFCDRQGR
jgi:hypothetical protein